MNISDILKIVSILVAVVFGVSRIWILLRHRYPVEITFLLDESIFLYDRVVKNIDDLKISYLDRPIRENAVLIKGFIIHTGTKDITPDMVEEKLSGHIAGNSIWHNVTIVKRSPHLAVEASIDPRRNVVTFTQNLFKRNEYFYFEALAETDTQCKLDQDLIFTQRISDSGKVRYVDSTKYKTDKSLLPNIITFIIFSLLAFGIFSSIFLDHPYSGSHIECSNGTVVPELVQYDTLRKLYHKHNRIYDSLNVPIDSFRKEYSANHTHLGNFINSDTVTYRLPNRLSVKVYPVYVMSAGSFFWGSVIVILLGILAIKPVTDGIKKLRYLNLLAIIQTGGDRKPIVKEILTAFGHVIRTSWPFH